MLVKSTIAALLCLSLRLVLAERVVTIVNRCPGAIDLYINGQEQGSLGRNGVTNRTFEDNWTGLIYTTAQDGEANGAKSTRAGFYGQTNYYYVVKDHLNVGISIVPKVITASLAKTAFCSTTSCDSLSCPASYGQVPSSFPAPGDAAPAAPLFECPGTNVGYTVSFCPEKTFPPPANFVTIHPDGSSKKCLDVRGAAFGDGTAVQIYDCNGSAAQRWVMSKAGSSMQVQLAGTSYCLDAGSDPSSGTGMKIWTCISNTAAQTFIQSGKKIKLASENQCVDLTGGSSKNGNQVQSWTCQSPTSPNQSWDTS